MCRLALTSFIKWGDGVEERKKELLSIFKERGKEIEARQLIEEVLFLEKKLEEVKELPFYKYNKNDRRQQKALPAAKLYRELLGQYNVSLKTLGRMIGTKGDGGTSPLREWAKNADQGKKDMDTG